MFTKKSTGKTGIILQKRASLPQKTVKKFTKLFFEKNILF